MADMNKTKADLSKENAELKTQLADVVEERSELRDALINLDERVTEMAAHQSANRETYDPEPVLLYDPFDEQNPHKILKNPDGWVLSWKNPDYRAHRGWRGWIPIEFDDEIGSELGKYLNDPPERMAGMAQIDNYVRRGTDSILCKLPQELWDARQQKRVSNAEYRFQQSRAVNQIRTKQFSTYGDGGTPGDVPIKRDGPAPLVQTRLFK